MLPHGGVHWQRKTSQGRLQRALARRTIKRTYALAIPLLECDDWESSGNRDLIRGRWVKNRRKTSHKRFSKVNFGGIFLSMLANKGGGALKV